MSRLRLSTAPSILLVLGGLALSSGCQVVSGLADLEPGAGGGGAAATSSATGTGGSTATGTGGAGGEGGNGGGGGEGGGGVCGDGHVDPGEDCDDGNQSNTDACPDDIAHGGDCKNAYCGDGFVEANVEECDDGNQDDTDGCIFAGGACKKARCGDGFIQTGVEDCDDGNESNDDTCVDDVANGGTCKVASCGDGFVQTGVEECDDGNQDNSDGCLDDLASGGACKAALCGDGVVYVGMEACDDGNLDNSDGCPDDGQNGGTCQLAACGDGFVRAGVEQCDDGNLDNGDDCPDDTVNGGACQGATCGDGLLWLGVEQCDDGNHSNADACLDDASTGGACQLATCGDGFVRAGVEQCDDGNQSNTDTCPDDAANGGTCQTALCGDGFLLAGVEQCDDGNQSNSDACLDNTVQGGTCVPATCGDGVTHVGVETCDDGNHSNSDACPDNLAQGGTCLVATCGDGFLQIGQEVCDDGNIADFDGCAGDCSQQAVCGNGQHDQLAGEPCDDGNAVNWDGCNTCVIREFRINTTTTGDQTEPDVAISDAGAFVVVWQSVVSGSTDVIAQRYGADGSKLGSEMTVNTNLTGNQYTPQVATTPDGWFVVTWQDQNTSQIKARRYDNNGAPNTGEIVVATGGNNPDVAMKDDKSFKVVWETDTVVLYQSFDTAAALSGAAVQIATGTNIDLPRIGMAGNGAFGVAWQATGVAYDVFARIYDSNGVALGPAAQVNTYTTLDQGQVDVGMDDSGRFVVAWESFGQISGLDVFFQTFGANGLPQLASEQNVNTQYTSYYQRKPGLGMNGSGAFVVSFESEQYSFGEDAIVARYDSSFSKVGSETLINGYLIGDPNDDQVQSRSAMAANGSFVVVWQSETQDGSGWGIYGQRFDPSGKALGFTN